MKTQKTFPCISIVEHSRSKGRLTLSRSHTLCYIQLFAPDKPIQTHIKKFCNGDQISQIRFFNSRFPLPDNRLAHIKAARHLPHRITYFFPQIAKSCRKIHLIHISIITQIKKTCKPYLSAHTPHHINCCKLQSSVHAPIRSTVHLSGQTSLFFTYIAFTPPTKLYMLVHKSGQRACFCLPCHICIAMIVCDCPL